MCAIFAVELYAALTETMKSSLLFSEVICLLICTLYLPLGRNFRHTLYPSYKSNRPPTPDTIVQGLQYLKASIKAMSIKVIEVIAVYHRFWLSLVVDYSLIFWTQVPGVEADDVIGTLALRSVDAGYKVILWSFICERKKKFRDKIYWDNFFSTVNF